MNKIGDIDLDFGDRMAILQHIQHISAARLQDGELVKHNTGVYVTPVPAHPVTGLATIDYKQGDARGYFKLDLLNVHLYRHVRDMNHLKSLLVEPDWSLLKNQQFVSQLIHLNGQWANLVRMPEPIDSIPRLAMFLAIIRPGKKHLIGLPWGEVAKTVWEKSPEGGYVFKKSHAVSYSHLVVVNMNLLGELGHLPDQHN